jgi:hypothetical protein
MRSLRWRARLSTFKEEGHSGASRAYLQNWSHDDLVFHARSERQSRTYFRTTSLTSPIFGFQPFQDGLPFAITVIQFCASCSKISSKLDQKLVSRRSRFPRSLRASVSHILPDHLVDLTRRGIRHFWVPALSRWAPFCNYCHSVLCFLLQNFVQVGLVFHARSERQSRTYFRTTSLTSPAVESASPSAQNEMFAFDDVLLEQEYQPRQRERARGCEACGGVLASRPAAGPPPVEVAKARRVIPSPISSSS